MRYLCLLSLLLAGMVFAGEQQIVLHEYINKAWSNELLHYNFSAPRNTCAPETVTLSGPRGPVPAQLSHIAYWPGGTTVKSARLSFIANLASLATDTYTIRYSPTVPDSSDRLSSINTNADLKFTPGNDSVEITTSKCGLRFPLGEKTYNPPVPASEVPGPLAGMRLADGAWCGGSRLYGPMKVAAFSAQLTGEGPIFGEVTLRYKYEDGTTMELSAALAAGDTQALWEMWVMPPWSKDNTGQLLAPGFNEGAQAVPQSETKYGWQLLLTPGLDPLQFIFIPEFGEKLWSEMKYDGWWHADPLPVSIDKEKPGPVMYLVPWSDWWDGRTKTSLTFKTDAHGECFAITAREPGRWVEAAAPGTWASWGNPRMRDKWAPLIHGEDGANFLQFSAATGLREWQMGNPQPGLGHQLNTVKDYVLDWPGDEGKHPRLYFGKADLAKRW
ncbi:MAG TPA: hypothetical protein VGM23_14835, partial [Armatimonadota bacterium]